MKNIHFTLIQFLFSALIIIAFHIPQTIKANEYWNETEIGGIVNKYSAVISFDPCENSIIVESTLGYFVGDTVLIIQMQGASASFSASNNFGSLTSLNNAGNFEFNYIKQIIGNTVYLLNINKKGFDYNKGSVQLVRVPYYKTNVKVINEITSEPWNGKTGGIVCVLADGNINLRANINVSGKGFRGGIANNRRSNLVECEGNDYFRGPNRKAGQKGESIIAMEQNYNYSKGRAITGGGGGVNHNSGGGGGGNAGGGGLGGYQLSNCGP